MSSEDHNPQPGWVSCFVARYDYTDSNGEVDGVTVAVASESWARRRCLPLGC
jgi:hypothetical protein